ncbi:hypothetical protein IMZ48_35575 [Candidatus Bathyarchaeota archaeon]|nr:hypothetical protein [Candidatus Bathyarchaeota archaeon]
MHISTTESILQWPHFDAFPSLRQDVKPIFAIEQSRQPMAIPPNPTYPHIDTETLSAILAAFESNVNFWYPTLSQSQLEKVRAVLEDGVPDDDTVQCCLTLLIMALGCVSRAVTNLRAARKYNEDEDEKQRRVRLARMGHDYFQLAMKKIHVVHLDVSSASTQCLLFTA